MKSPLMQRSIRLGTLIGAVFGGVIGVGVGAITSTLSGILIGAMLGLLLGGLTGALTAALTVRTAGTTGGIGVGYFTGMVFGGVFGMFLGALIPVFVRSNANTQGIPALDALTMGRFETAMLTSFLFSILATMVGTWVGGKNLVPRNLTVERQERIDQFDLVEVVVVPEQYQGIMEVGDIGAAIEIYNHEEFEVECLNPDGSYKWLAILNNRYIRLKSKIPDNM